MTPPPPPASSAAAAARAGRPARGAERDRNSASRRAPLRVVSTRPGATLRRRLVRVLPIVMVVGALMVVVGGQAMLANGQVRLAGIENTLATEQAVDRQTELAVSRLETPPRIVAAAISKLGLVHPAGVTQLPYTSLTTPLPTPTVEAPPAATATPTTPTTAVTTTTTTAPGQ